ncbi:hypothetical protein J8I87_15730 [Paraburkholderia sp. LEh10]|uniref:hypothetical protein n=1 Tax=Paraburkholderia sp. LEh10 TaxID=2821353 RepID=UPI001AE909C0|nr:hypothetical protein [Paraburkholderia sp. LEh10]MBP0591138.1 hypothetical protein [Paraburkholderia sp. LEh10]
MKTTTGVRRARNQDYDIGVDLAKCVFRVDWMDMETGEIGRRQLKRDAFVQFFSRIARPH